ncbi:chromate transporter [Alicyclobacillus dauci]|uniref:Chromate transporter n=1 Tax=Alicyclobacillus dauci TaxID=1475485 RepID=A0ABY6Z336_9BACL|nr:chromate transporter [Alicyclobacillus dauci]WAH37262.1 chromate transporter [Alicyclobacillus dauci]
MLALWWKLFLGFFIANILGYGGGPSTIPLMQAQIVHHYGWMSNAQFANLLAIANALPGPIATKIATALGYQVGGVVGIVVAIIATVVPSALLLIVLLRVLNRFRDSRVVKGMTRLIQPAITILMLLMTWELFHSSTSQLGIFQSLILAVIAFLLIEWRKVHPAFVIIGAFVYGGLLVPHIPAF